jgi:hypothetical protein
LFSNFDFDIEHIKGTTNSLADFLSRENSRLFIRLLLFLFSYETIMNILKIFLTGFLGRNTDKLWVPRWGLETKEDY